MSAESPLVVDCNEKTTLQYTTTLKDETETVIPSASINSITLTIIEEDSGDVVNSRNAQSILNANGGTMHATSGLLTMVFTASDTEIVGGADAGEIETHLATIDITWATTKKAHREIEFRIRNLRSVT